MTSNAPRAGIYARISQADPEVEKTADQVARCRALVASAGYEVADTFIDDGISAFTGKARPEWLRLNDAITAGVLDVVVAVAEDRFTRNAHEKIGFQVQCARHAVTWHTISSGPVDPSTAQGALMSTITGAIAEFESHIKRERILASVARRVAEGKDLGGPRPFGFQADRITPDPVEAVVVRDCYRIFIETNSIYAVTKHLNQTGVRSSLGKEWGWSSVRKMLARRRNMGVLEHKGEVVRSDLPPIVDEGTFETVQALLKSRPKRAGRTPTYLLSGMLTCGRCGDRMVAASSAYYGCRGKHGTNEAARQERVATAVHPSITRRIAEQAVKERLFMRLVTLAQVQAAEQEPAHAGEVRAKLAELRRQRDVAQQLAMMPGVNMEMVRKQMLEFEAEEERLKEELSAALRADSIALLAQVARESLVDLGAGVALLRGREAFDVWEPRFDALPVDKRQAMIRAAFHSITVAPDKRGPGRLVFDPPGAQGGRPPAVVEVF